MMCAQQGSPETIKLLLDKGADIEKRKPDGLNALMIAAAWDQAAIVQLLLDRGADINAKDRNGFTALAYAKKPAATKVLKDARLDLAVLLAEDRFEDEALTDELIDSKNRFLPGYLAAATPDQLATLLSSVEKRLIQAQRRVAELNSAAEDAVRAGGNATDFRTRTAKVQAYMSVLKAIQRALSESIATAPQS